MALQMTWTNTHKRESAPLGLRNLGNSCYLNSVLQCLTYTPPLANFCLNNRHSSLCELSNLNKRHDCPFCMLEKRIVRSLSIEIPMDAPAKIQNSIQIFAKHFRIGRQEDAHEFLRYVIDACHNTCLKLLKARNEVAHQNDQANGKFEKAEAAEPKTIVKEIFGGLLQSQVKCLSCSYESNKMDDMMDISLDLFQSSSVREALQRFFRSEVLDGSNKYNCEKCKKLSAAKKQMSIFRAPNVLVIQLKRFEGMHGMKIDRSIVFEEDLSLLAHMNKASKDPHPKYSLFGSIVHSGYSPESGHYYAYIKDPSGRWYCCNDSIVTLATLEEVLSEKVYVLFFIRTNQRPRVVKSSVPNANGVNSCNGKEASAPKAMTYFDKQSPVVLTNGNCPAKGLSNVSKNEEDPSKARIKFSISRTALPESVKNVANGSGQLSIHHDASKERLRRTEGLPGQMHKEVPLPGRDTVSGTNFSNKDVNAITDRSSVLPYRANDTTSNDKHSFVSDSKNAVKPFAEMENNVSHVRVVDGIRNSNAMGTKRKVCDSHSADNANSSSNGLHSLSEQENRCKSSSVKEHFAGELELKEMLCQEACSFLRTSCWYHGVCTLMRNKKRLCMRDSSIPHTDLKRFLISEAKKSFNSQIPQALKERLLKDIQPFMSGQQ